MCHYSKKRVTPYADEQAWVWQRPYDHLLPNYIFPTVKFGGGAVFLSRCFQLCVLKTLHVVAGKLNSDAYMNSFENHVFIMLWQFYVWTETWK